MNFIKFLPAALLLSFSLGAYAQDDEETEVVAEDEAAEVFVPSTSVEKPFFHRVQIGYFGTNAKYTNDNPERQARVPMSEKYFLSGISLGWIGDIVLAKKIPLYLELGGLFGWQTGKDNPYYNNPSYDDIYSARVNAVSLTIPVSVTYLFRNPWGVEDLTIAPLAGIYGRFNLLAERKLKNSETGVTDTRSLMKYSEDGGWMEGRKHTGKLLQIGAQVGANAFWKHYSFGVTYMIGFMPFASHNSPLGLSAKSTDQGGLIPSSGTGCDMKISTLHNVAVNFGYIF